MILSLLNTFPIDTTCSFITRAGIDITPYSITFCKSVMYSISMESPVALTASLVFSYRAWQFLQPEPRTLIQQIPSTLSPQQADDVDTSWTSRVPHGRDVLISCQCVLHFFHIAAVKEQAFWKIRAEYIIGQGKSDCTATAAAVSEPLAVCTFFVVLL